MKPRGKEKTTPSKASKALALETLDNLNKGFWDIPQKRLGGRGKETDYIPFIEVHSLIQSKIKGLEK